MQDDIRINTSLEGNIMCQTGGLRCSSHAEKTLNTATKNLAKLSEQGQKKQEKRNEALAVLKNTTEDDKNYKKVQGKFMQANDELHAVQEKFNNAKAKVRIAQREFDGTPRGVEILNKRLESASTSEEKAMIERRIKQGSMLRGWHANKHANLMAQQKTGLDDRGRRGKKFLFGPPASTEELVPA